MYVPLQNVILQTLKSTIEDIACFYLLFLTIIKEFDLDNMKTYKYKLYQDRSFQLQKHSFIDFLVGLLDGL